MAITLKTPDQVADEYLATLKSLKPSVNISQTDSDWWIRSRVHGGVVSGIYADQRKIANDAFPQSARTEALEKHLQTYFNTGFNAAQAAAGSVRMSGATGSFIPLGTQMTYGPNGNVYEVSEDTTLIGPTASVPVRSVGTGQVQNLLAGAGLTLSSPPAGVDSSATVIDAGITDGRNAETKEEAAARILARVRTPPAGGTESDYEQYALAASPSVITAKVKRWIYGLGTVGLYITAGTADIDQAVDEGQAITRIPSQSLIDTVRAYVDALNPTTDCLHVLPPNEVGQDVTVRVKYKSGYSGTTILSGQTLTLNQLLVREVGRALYKIPTGGRVLGASGYVLASEIEEAIDEKLSSTPYAVGTLAEVLIDRQVLDLAASGTNRLLAFNEIVKPGTVTIQEM